MWKFFDTGSLPGKINMLFDEFLAREWTPRTGLQCFRLYGWNPPAVSLGYHQEENEIDREKLQSEGIDLVRRPTGGRAILHLEEITYSVVMRADGSSVNEVYEKISRALVYGLRSVGYDVYFAQSHVHYPSFYRTENSIPCFASSGLFEVQLNNKKLIGSAQRHYKLPDGRVIALQHGSILTGPTHVGLTDFLNLDGEKRKQMRENLTAHTISLREVSRPQYDEYKIKDALIDALGEHVAGGSFEKEDHIPIIESLRETSITTEQIL